MDKDARAHLKDPIGKPSGAELEKKRLDLRGQSVAEIVSILTSPPIGCEDGVDDAPSHASAIAPPSSAVPLEPPRFANAPPTMPRIADAPPMRPGIGDTNLDLQPLKSRPFEGETAVGDLAHRLSHAPGLPEPPIQTRQRPVVARFGRLPFVVISAAIVAIGATSMTFPNEVRKSLGDISGMMMRLFEGSSRSRTAKPLPHLVVKGQKGFVNEPLPLGVSLNGASDEDMIFLAGLAIGTSLSAGAPLGLTSWLMLARDVDNVLVYAPKDFVGIMVAAIDLRSPSDWLMDNRTVRLEWIQKGEEPLAPQIDPSKHKLRAPIPRADEAIE